MTVSVYLATDLTHRFVDNNGNALVGGLLYTYASGTTTNQATYTDSTGNTANSNPIVLDSRGECNLWLDATKQYKFVLKDSSGTLIRTIDGAPGASLPGAIATSGRSVFTSNGSFTVPTAVTDIYVSAVAGGGGGGGGAGNNAVNNVSGGGAGGSAGQSIQAQHYTVTPGAIISITIGSGGSGGTGGSAGDNVGDDGSAGGNTVVGSLVTLTGGGGGSGGGNSGTSGAGGAPSATGYPSGSYGDDGLAYAGGGAGASSPFGGGGGRGRGANSTAGAPGNPGGGYGSGGGGGGALYSATSGAGGNGAAGKSGFVLIEY